MKFTFYQQLLFLFFLNTISQNLFAQYTHQDSLRGTLSKERSCYDVSFYDLKVKVDPVQRNIKGSNTIYYTSLENFDLIQIDLFENMKIESIIFQGQSLNFEREGNATFVKFPQTQTSGSTGNFTINFSGKPRTAVNAPWDGGFTWTKDKNNKDWVAVSCEGIGASLWWPNKDHLSDEPDSMRITGIVPRDLQCIANGNLRNSEDTEEGYKSFEWFVSYPINNYNVTLNIGNYTHFSEEYMSEDGEVMPLDYYVLPEDLKQAQKQFLQVKPMLTCYEKYFGKYPFWKDGFALVETPYLGMEHQGAVAYGNRFLQGYLGNDLTGTGIGLLFDYIIIHEAGHEYWGNSVSCQDHAEMWIHESFCTYSEGLYVECLYGKEKAQQYYHGYKKIIQNTEPIIGDFGVNSDGSGDMYAKGAVVLNMLRNIMNDDALWFKIIRGISEEFKYKNILTKDLIQFINEESGKDYTSFFQQYLYKADIPTLEYEIKEKGGKYTLNYRWNASVRDFSMPIEVMESGKSESVFLMANNNEYQSRSFEGAPSIVADKYYFKENKKSSEKTPKK